MQVSLFGWQSHGEKFRSIYLFSTINWIPHRSLMYSNNSLCLFLFVDANRIKSQEFQKCRINNHIHRIFINVPANHTEFPACFTNLLIWAYNPTLSDHSFGKFYNISDWLLSRANYQPSINSKLF